jgi:hypothetical protein
MNDWYSIKVSNPLPQFISTLIMGAGTEEYRVPSTPQVPTGTQSVLNGVPTSAGTGTDQWVRTELELLKARVLKLEQALVPTVKEESKPYVGPLSDEGIVKQEEPETKPVEPIHLDLVPPEGIELPPWCPGWGKHNYLLHDGHGLYHCVLCTHAYQCRLARENALRENSSTTPVPPLPVQDIVKQEEPASKPELMRQDPVQPKGVKLALPVNGMIKEEQPEPKVEQTHLELVAPDGLELPQLCPGWGNYDHDLTDSDGNNVCWDCAHAIACIRVQKKVIEQNQKSVVDPIDPKEEQWQAFLKEKNLSITEVVMLLKDLPSIKWQIYLTNELEVPFELLQTALRFCAQEAIAQGFLS